MLDNLPLHGPSIDDLVRLNEFEQMSTVIRWQLIFLIAKREGLVLKAQQRLPTDSIAYKITSEKLAALRQIRLTIWSSLHPKFNERIHLAS